MTTVPAPNVVIVHEWLLNVSKIICYHSKQTILHPGDARLILEMMCVNAFIMKWLLFTSLINQSQTSSYYYPFRGPIFSWYELTHAPPVLCKQWYRILWILHIRVFGSGSCWVSLWQLEGAKIWLLSIYFSSTKCK